MLLDNLQEVLRAAAVNKFGHTICIWGKHGIGKTQLLEGVAQGLNYRMRNLRVAQIDSTEVIGFPTKKTATVNGVEIEYLDYAPPAWWVDAMEGNFIIFLDEINRAKSDMQQTLFELVRERRLNGKKLPDSVLIIAACNPDDPKYTTHQMDAAMMDRFVHVHAESNYDVWQNWARQENPRTKKRNIAPQILNFLANDKSRKTFDYIESSDRSNPFGEEVKPSPRSWEKVNDIFMMQDLSLDLRQTLIAGVVGEEVAVGFIQSLRDSNKPITLDEIAEMSPETVERIKMYAQLDDSRDNGKVSVEHGEQIVEMALLNHTCTELAEKENEAFTHKHADKVLEFLSLISSDMAQTALKKLCKGPSNKKFWDEKLKEQLLDANGKPIPLAKPLEIDSKQHPNKLRWERLVLGLLNLHHARQNMNQHLINPSKT